MTDELQPQIDPARKKIGWLEYLALSLFGPADSWDSPLVGTRWDPLRRQQAQRRQLASRDARALRRYVRRHPTVA